jgi:hypothetical protein
MPASVDSSSTPSNRPGAGLACPDTCDVLTLRASRAGRALVEDAPTSDVSMVVLEAPHERPQPPCSSPSPRCRACGVKPREPSPKRVGPVKGTCGLEPRRLLSCSDMTTSPRSWSAPCESGVFRVRHGAPVRPISAAARVSVLAVSFGLDAAVSRAVPPLSWRTVSRRKAPRCVRPTSATQPIPVYLYPRSWLSSCLSHAGVSPSMRNGSRDTTFHDAVARFRRIRRRGARVFAEAVRTGRASDTPVARSWRRAALSGDCVFTFEPRPPSPRLREETGRVDDRRCLPSVGRPGYRTFRRSPPASCDAEPS